MTTQQDTAPVLDVFCPATGDRERAKEPTPTSALPGVVRRARAAQLEWAERAPKQRSPALLAVVDYLLAHAEDYADRISRANGKTPAEAMMSEVYPTLATFKFFAKRAHRHLQPQKLKIEALPMAYSRIHYEPLGVVGFISPWNFPFKLMLQDVPAALMAGNAVIIKVSEHAVAAGELVEELIDRAGLPRDLVQLIYGYGDLGAALIEAGIDKVVFTGSTATGRRVYEAAARQLIPCALELGGKDAAILLDDADLDDAARGVLWSGLTNSGQACASVELVFVPDRHKPAFLDRLGTLVRSLPAGSVGSMNVRFQRDKVNAQVAQARERGATVVAESVQGDPQQPYRCNPVVLTDVPEDCELFRDETFGPVLTVAGYSDLDGVLAKVNDSPYGLTTSVWTRDRRRGEQLARRIDSGVVTVNEHMITPGMPEAPWLGHKESGLGVSMSYLSLHAFSKVKYVYHDRGIVKFKFWRYPHSAAKSAWFRRFLEAEFASSMWRRLLHMAVAMPRMLFSRNPRFEDSDSR